MLELQAEDGQQQLPLVSRQDGFMWSTFSNDRTVPHSIVAINPLNILDCMKRDKLQVLEVQAC